MIGQNVPGATDHKPSSEPGPRALSGADHPRSATHALGPCGTAYGPAARMDRRRILPTAAHVEAMLWVPKRNPIVLASVMIEPHYERCCQ
jgi:hypothetical protein